MASEIDTPASLTMQTRKVEDDGMITRDCDRITGAYSKKHISFTNAFQAENVQIGGIQEDKRGMTYLEVAEGNVQNTDEATKRLLENRSEEEISDEPKVSSHRINDSLKLEIAKEAEEQTTETPGQDTKGKENSHVIISNMEVESGQHTRVVHSDAGKDKEGMSEMDAEIGQPDKHCSLEKQTEEIPVSVTDALHTGIEQTEGIQEHEQGKTDLAVQEGNVKNTDEATGRLPENLPEEEISDAPKVTRHRINDSLKFENAKETEEHTIETLGPEAKGKETSARISSNMKVESGQYSRVIQSDTGKVKERISDMDAEIGHPDNHCLVEKQTVKIPVSVTDAFQTENEQIRDIQEDERGKPDLAVAEGNVENADEAENRSEEEPSDEAKVTRHRINGRLKFEIAKEAATETPGLEANGKETSDGIYSNMEVESGQHTGEVQSDSEKDKEGMSEMDAEIGHPDNHCSLETQTVEIPSSVRPQILECPEIDAKPEGNASDQKKDIQRTISTNQTASQENSESTFSDTPNSQMLSASELKGLEVTAHDVLKTLLQVGGEDIIPTESVLETIKDEKLIAFSPQESIILHEEKKGSQEFGDNFDLGETSNPCFKENFQDTTVSTEKLKNKLRIADSHLKGFIIKHGDMREDEDKNALESFLSETRSKTTVKGLGQTGLGYLEQKHDPDILPSSDVENHNHEVQALVLEQDSAWKEKRDGEQNTNCPEQETAEEYREKSTTKTDDTQRMILKKASELVSEDTKVLAPTDETTSSKQDETKSLVANSENEGSRSDICEVEDTHSTKYPLDNTTIADVEELTDFGGTNITSKTEDSCIVYRSIAVKNTDKNHNLISEYQYKNQEKVKNDCPSEEKSYIEQASSVSKSREFRRSEGNPDAEATTILSLTMIRTEEKEKAVLLDSEPEKIRETIKLEDSTETTTQKNASHCDLQRARTARREEKALSGHSSKAAGVFQPIQAEITKPCLSWSSLEVKEDDIRSENLHAAKGEDETTLTEEKVTNKVVHTYTEDFITEKQVDSIEFDKTEVKDLVLEKHQMIAESQFIGILQKSAAQKTAERVYDGKEDEMFTQENEEPEETASIENTLKLRIVNLSLGENLDSPIEKSAGDDQIFNFIEPTTTEIPVYLLLTQEVRDTDYTLAPPGRDNSSIESIEINEGIVQTPLKANTDDKPSLSLDMAYMGVEAGNENKQETNNNYGEIPESTIVNCAMEADDLTSEQDNGEFHEEMIGISQTLNQEEYTGTSNGFKEDTIDSSSTKRTTSDFLKDMKLIDRHPYIEEGSVTTETEIREAQVSRVSKKQTSIADGSCVDQLSKPTREEAANDSCEADDVAAETYDNKMVLEKMGDQNKNISKFDVAKENVIILAESTESDQENVTDTALGHNDHVNELKNEKCRCRSEETKTSSEPDLSDHATNATKTLETCSETSIANVGTRNDGAISIETGDEYVIEKSVAAEAVEKRSNMMADTDNTTEAVLKEPLLDNTLEDGNLEKCILPENQLDISIPASEVIEDTLCIANSREDIPQWQENQSMNSNDVRESALMPIGEERTTKKNNENRSTPELQNESISESNNEKVQKDRELAQPCEFHVNNEPNTEKHTNIGEAGAEEEKYDHGSQYQESTAEVEGKGSNEHDQDTIARQGDFAKIAYDKIQVDEMIEKAPLDTENNDSENVYLESISDIASPEKISEPLGAAHKLEHCPKSVAAYESSATSSEANKYETEEISTNIEEHDAKHTDYFLTKEDNENQALHVMRQEIAFQVEYVSITDDFDQGIKEQKLNEETQIFKKDTEEDFQQVLTEENADDKNEEPTDPVAKHACFSESTNVTEAFKGDDGTTSIAVKDGESEFDENLNDKGYRATNAYITEGIEILCSVDTPKDVDQCNEELQIDDETQITERESIQRECQQDMQGDTSYEVKSLEANFDPQPENERKTGRSDVLQVQEDERAHEKHQYDGMYKSDPWKDEELLSQGFEVDSPSNTILNRKKSKQFEVSGQNAGVDIDTLGDHKSAKIANDESQIGEANAATGIMAEHHILKNDDHEDVYNGSPEKILTADVVEKLQHKTKSAEACVKSISAKPNKYEADENRGEGVEYSDGKPDEQLQEGRGEHHLGVDGVKIEQQTEGCTDKAQDFDQNIESAALVKKDFCCSESIEETAVLREKHQINEDCESTSKEKIDEDEQQDPQIKEIDYELKNDRNTWIYDQHNQESKGTYELCKFSEMDGDSLKDQEVIIQENEGEIYSKRVLNEQTSTSFRLSGPYIDAEMSVMNQNESAENSKGETKTAHANKATEETEHHKQKQEAPNGSIYEEEVKCVKASTIEMDTENTEVKDDQPGASVVEEVSEECATSAKSPTSEDVLEPESGTAKESTSEEEKQNTDSSENKMEKESMQLAIEEISSQEILLQQNTMKALDVSAKEETQSKNNKTEFSSYDDDCIQAEREDEINMQPEQTLESENVALVIISAIQSVQERELDAAKQEGNVSNVTVDCINTETVYKITAEETVQTQMEQTNETKERMWLALSEQLEQTLEAAMTSTAKNKGESTKIPHVQKDENRDGCISENKAQRTDFSEMTPTELETYSDLEPIEDLVLKPEVKEVRKTTEFSVPKNTNFSSESQTHAADSIARGIKEETESITESWSVELRNKDDFQLPYKPEKTTISPENDSVSILLQEEFGHICEVVTDSEGSNENSEQVTEGYDQEQTKPEDSYKEWCHPSVNIDLIEEELKTEENYEGQRVTVSDTTNDENLVQGSLKIVISKEESRQLEEIREKNKEILAEADDHLAKSAKTLIGNVDSEGIILNMEETKRKLDDSFISKDKDAEEASKALNIGDEFTNFERENHVTTGEIPAHEVNSIDPKADDPDLRSERNAYDPVNVDVQPLEKTLQARGLNQINASDFLVAKTLNISPTTEIQQNNDDDKFSLMVENMAAEGKLCIRQPEYKSKDVTSRKINLSQSPEKQNVDYTERGVEVSGVNAQHINCQDIEEITAADIIASHISLAIVRDEQEQSQPSSSQKHVQEHQTSTTTPDADKKIVCDWVSGEGNRDDISCGKPTGQACLLEERREEIEFPNMEHKPIIDSQTKQELPVKVQASSMMLMPEEVSSKFQGTASSSECKEITDKDNNLHSLFPANLNEYKVHDSPELNLDREQISEVSLEHARYLPTTMTLNSEHVVQIFELQVEKLTKSEKTDQDNHHKTISSELIAEEISSLNFEANVAAMSEVPREEVLSEKPTLVQHSLQKSKSCDKAQDSVLMDEQDTSITVSVSLVSDKTDAEAPVLLSSEDKTCVNFKQLDSENEGTKSAKDYVLVVSDDSSGKHHMENWRDFVHTHTHRIVDEKEQEFQETSNEFNLLPQLQDSSCNVSTDEFAEEPAGTRRKLENDIEEEPKEQNQIEAYLQKGTYIVKSKGNEVPSPPQVEPIKWIEEIAAEKSNETVVHLLPTDSDKPSLSNKKQASNAQTSLTSGSGTEVGYQVIKVTTVVREEPIAQERQLDEDKEGEGDDESQADSEWKVPMVADTTEIEMKASHKKTHNILSGVGSKVKHSISKVKKAIACTSPQYAPEDVIIKLNKHKKG